MGISILAYKRFLKISSVACGVDWVFLGWVFGGDEAERTGARFAVGGLGVGSLGH